MRQVWIPAGLLFIAFWLFVLDRALTAVWIDSETPVEERTR